MQFYAYTYSHPLTLEVVYVGKGSRRNGRDRAFVHKQGARDKDFNEWIISLKDANLEPKIDILYVDSEEAAFKLEADLIQKYGRSDLKSGTLFNKTNGQGAAGLVYTDERRKQVSESCRATWSKPEVLEKHREMLITRHADPEFKEKFLESIRTEEVQNKRIKTYLRSCVLKRSVIEANWPLSQKIYYRERAKIRNPELAYLLDYYETHGNFPDDHVCSLESN